jgi:hypothetical protein
MHPAWLAVVDDDWIGGGIRRFQSERSVRTMGVVVGGVDPVGARKSALESELRVRRGMR